MTETFPPELANFFIDSVPSYHDFSQDLPPSDSFFRSRNDTTPSQDENATPTSDIAVSEAVFKRPFDPVLPTTSSNNSVKKDESQIADLNLGALAACNGPRKPLRRSQLNDQAPNDKSTNVNGRSGVTVAPIRPRSDSRGQVSNKHRSLSRPSRNEAMTTHESRREGSMNRGVSSHRHDSIERTLPRSSFERSNAPIAPQSRPSASSAKRPPIPAPRIRSSGHIVASARQTGPVRVGGEVMTRSQTRTVSSSTHSTIERLSNDVANLTVQPRGSSQRRPSTTSSSSTIRIGRDRIRRSGSMATGAVRVGSIRVSSTGGPTTSANGPRTSGSTSPSSRRAATPSCGVGSGLIRKPPTPSSIDRLSAPRTIVGSTSRTGIALSGTPRRAFSSALRSYGPIAPNHGPTTISIPQTPQLRTVQRSISARRVPQSAPPTVPGLPRPISNHRPHRVDIDSVVARLSKPRTNGTSVRTEGRVAVGHTHGMPIPSRHQPAFRSRSASRDGRLGGVHQSTSIDSVGTSDRTAHPSVIAQ